MGTGHDQLHNYAFLGASGRIGTASDVIYAFVPAGPKKQLDMFFHGIECRRNGLEEVVRAAVACSLGCLSPCCTAYSLHYWQCNLQAFKGALQLTPLSSSDKGAPWTTRETGHVRTWFHARRWYFSLNSAMQVLAHCLPVIYSGCCLTISQNIADLQSREETYLRTMRVGLHPWRASLLRMHLQLEKVFFWCISCVLGCVELMHLRVF